MNNKTIAFNLKRSLRQILYSYFVQNDIELYGIKKEYITMKIVKTLIYRDGIFVNSVKTYDDNLEIQDRDRIGISQFHIDFTCLKNPNLDDEQIFLKKKKDAIKIYDEPVMELELDSGTKGDIDDDNCDEYIVEFLRLELGINSIDNLNSVDIKKAHCYIILLFQNKEFEQIKKSVYSYQLTDFVKDVFVSSGLSREMDLPKSQNSFTGKIIENLIRVKKEKENQLEALVAELIAGLHNQNLYRFLQNYSKIVASISFQYLIAPMLENVQYGRAGLENLIKPINEANALKNDEEKYIYFGNNEKIYTEYFRSFEGGQVPIMSYFIDIGKFLFSTFKKVCDTDQQKSAELDVRATSKKYNFKNSERLTQDIFLNIKNYGEGLAKSIKIKSNSELFEFSDYFLGLLKGGEALDISIKTKLNSELDFVPELRIILEWEETIGSVKSKLIPIKLAVQNADVPWERIMQQSPYSIQIIEEKSKLFGRDEILEELKNNILSNNIESYKIWGQKRVGKSSIVKTLKSLYNDSENVLIIYRSILGLRNPDPIKTLNDLGESICSEIINEIENKIRNSHLREQLKNISIPVFSGSFYPLEKFILKLHSIADSLKFVIIIDEFDRINEEFFKAGDLGEGLSGSIGKALNEIRFIGFILVGSENMQLLDRQGMNYNSYLEREVDTFKKESEYISFKNIVLGPVLPYISYSEDAIDRIFDITNGNPYFTNLICKESFKTAFRNKDSDIDIKVVNEAIDLIVNSSQKSHFEHFWGDGLVEESDARRDRTTDLRRRILVSYSINSTQNINDYPNKNEILRKFKYPDEYVIEKYEVENTITEFHIRKIFNEKNGIIRIKPKLFESWLCGPGKSLMIEGVADLEALHRQLELEEEFSLKEQELLRLSETLEFQGTAITIEKLRNYFKQFGGSIEQRRIFKLLDSIFYISNEEISDFFRKEQKNIFSKIEFELKFNSRPYRDNIELYCLDESIQENQPLTETFKRLTFIRSTKTIKNIKTENDAWKKNDSREIIIIESVIDDTDYLISELQNFITEEIKQKNIPIRLVTLLITTKAKTNIVKATSSLTNFKIIVFREVEETKIKPFILGTELFENSEQSNLAFAEVRKKFPMISRDTSLLVLFGSYCPSKSCPILWHKSSQFKPLFLNEFGSLEELKFAENKEESRRTRIYHANIAISQKMNFYIVEHLKRRAKADGKDDWFLRDYIPKSVMETVSSKWITEGTSNARETYFDFLDYKKIIEHNSELAKFFKLPGEDLSWCDKLNVLRRDPAHPEKPAPSEKDVEYFEKIKDQVLEKLG